MFYRVKELTKEAAKRSNSSLSPASHSAATVPRSFETAPDIVPRNALRQPGTKPSLFHPSNIQLSSTPLKNAVVHKSADENLDSILLDAENDLPISGHRLGSGSSSGHDRRLDRISPIHDTSRYETASVGKSEVNGKRSSGNEVGIAENRCELPRNGTRKFKPDLSNGEPSLMHNDGQEVGVTEDKREPASPCSCRSLNASFVKSQLSPQLDCDCSVSSGTGKPGMRLPKTQNFSSVRHLPSSVTDRQQLFAETKARMESARANIHNFLEYEKTRTTDVSRSSCLDFVDNEQLRTGMINVDRTDLERKPEGSSLSDANEMIPTCVRSSENVSVTLDIGLAADVAATETTSSSHQNTSSEPWQQGGVSRENGGRSWAEILEHSSHNRSSRSVTAAALPDLSCSGDDVVTPEMLDTLKARIKELKRRQEQLERDQHLFTQDEPAAANLFPITFAAPSDAKPNDVLSSVSETGTLSMSHKMGQVAAGVKVDDSLPSARSGLQRTSAARNLLFEFTKLPTLSERSTVPVLSSTSLQDVEHQTDGSDHTHAVPSLINRQHQHRVVSSSSNHQHDGYMPPVNAESQAVKSSDGETLVMEACAESQVRSSAVSIGSVLGKPTDDLQTCVSDDKTHPESSVTVTGSANPNAESSSVQPVCVVSSNVATVFEACASHPVATTVLVSSAKADVISTAAVAKSNSLPSHSAENLTALQFPVRNAMPTGSSYATASLNADTLPGNYLDSIFQPIEPKAVLPAPYGMMNPSSFRYSDTDQQTVKAGAFLKAASIVPPTNFPPITGTETTLGGKIESRRDAENFIHIFAASSVVAGSASDGDMIQHSHDDVAKQLLRSVCKCFTYLFCRIIVLDLYIIYLYAEIPIPLL